MTNTIESEEASESDEAIAVIRALSSALVDRSDPSREQAALDLHFGYYRSIESLHSMGLWLASRANWSVSELRRALRCNLSIVESEQVDIPTRRLELCEDYIRAICASISDFDSIFVDVLPEDTVRKMVRFGADLFAVSGWRSIAARTAAVSRDTESSALEEIARGNVAGAYAAALPHPQLLRREPRSWPVEAHLATMASKSDTSYVEQVHLARRQYASDHVDSAGLDVWNVCLRAASLHWRSVDEGKGTLIARATAAGLAAGSDVFFDIRLSPFTSETNASSEHSLISEAYDQLVESIVGSTEHRSSLFALACLFRASAELWRYSSILVRVG